MTNHTYNQLGLKDTVLIVLMLIALLSPDIILKAIAESNRTGE